MKRVGSSGESLGKAMEELDEWRAFFQSSGADLMTLIDRAITVASLDKPKDLLRKREGFTEKLFAPSLHASLDLNEVDNAGSDGRDSSILEPKTGGKPEIDDGHDTTDDPELNDGVGCSYEEAEALSDEMEEESRQMKEILLIKDRLANYDQSEDKEIFQSLETLEKMQLSFEALRETEIGKQVNNVRKHSSKCVQSIARRLLRQWKSVFAEWYKSVGDLATDALSGHLQENIDECGLPSPPLDEGALLAAPTTTLEMNQLFEFIDDELRSGEKNSPAEDGNLPVEVPKSNGCELQPSAKGKSLDYAGNDSKSIKESTERDKGRKGSDIKRRESSRDSQKEALEEAEGLKSNRKSIEHNAACENRRNTNSSSTFGFSQTVQGNGSLKRKPDLLTREHENGSKYGVKERQVSPEAISVTERLAAAKQKLHDGYQQAEKAKKQRTVQVMELQDLPKRGTSRAKVTIQSKPNIQNHTSSSSMKHY